MYQIIVSGVKKGLSPCLGLDCLLPVPGRADQHRVQLRDTGLESLLPPHHRIGDTSTLARGARAAPRQAPRPSKRRSPKTLDACLAADGLQVPRCLPGSRRSPSADIQASVSKATLWRPSAARQASRRHLDYSAEHRLHHVAEQSPPAIITRPIGKTGMGDLVLKNVDLGGCRLVIEVAVKREFGGNHTSRRGARAASGGPPRPEALWRGGGRGEGAGENKKN